MFTALASLALLGLVVVSGFVYSNKMDELLSGSRGSPPDAAAARP